MADDNLPALSGKCLSVALGLSIVLWLVIILALHGVWRFQEVRL